jgi:hypothetical protein
MTHSAVNPPGQLLVIGGGYTGQRFAQAAQAQFGLPVLLTSRQAKAPPSPGQPALHWLVFNTDSATAESSSVPSPAELAGTTHVLVTLPPDRSGRDPALEHLGPILQQLPLQWLGYLSTTGVYGDCGGAWVDETAPCQANLGRSQARRTAEQSWQASGLPVQIFRLPAIYGPHRSPFKALLAGDSRLIHKVGQVFSRVHVDDIVGALLHCLSQPLEERPAVVNVVDNCPCPSSETLGFAAHLLGCKLPPAERFEAIAESMSPMARSFWADNRRASNSLLCEGLGYQLRYPSYREGYRACLAEEGPGAQSVESAGSVT